MLKILSIGNSFSQNAHAYVHDIARAAGKEMLFGNLVIGGCSLERHCSNIGSASPEYLYARNSRSIAKIALETGLADEDWDVVTLQQASQFSGMPETYAPWLQRLSGYVRQMLPRAEQVIHQTWAYEADATHPGFSNYACNQHNMYEAVVDAYNRAADSIGGARIIPCGDAVQLARSHPLFDRINGGRPLSADGFHLNATWGQYLAGAVWYEFFTGESTIGNNFVPRVVGDVYIGQDHSAATFTPITEKRVLAPEMTPSPEEMAALQSIAHNAISLRQSYL